MNWGGCLLLGLLLATISACSSPPACTPGVTRTCACTAGQMGVQSCNSMGSGYEACGQCCAQSCGARTCGFDPMCNMPCGSGCSSGQMCDATGTCIATSHTLAEGTSPLFDTYFGAPFTVLTTGYVAYSTRSAADSYGVAIFDEANWAIYSSGGSTAVAYASHDRVGTATDGAMVPAGNYRLGFVCRNLLERCSIIYAVAGP